MDLNKLYFDHQLLLIRAKRAASFGARHEHEVRASQVAGRISRMQRTLGAAAAPTWELLTAVEDRPVVAPRRHQQGCA